MAKKAPASRIATLKERVEAAEKKGASTSDVPFRGEIVPLRKIKIECDFPLYRIQSGRTHRAQCEYLERHPNLPNDFFSDPEDPKVQRAQEEILQRMVAERELDEDLKSRGQRQPIVLTADGYVVDGNRRLAALRAKNAHYVDAVVLPADAQAHEIYETELEFQMQRETKAPYNWVDQALHIELGIQDLDETPAKVARRMRLTEKQILSELEKLSLVRQYLVWAGHEGQYHKVPSGQGGGNMQQAFEELVKGMSSPAMRRKSEKERRLVRDTCFAAIKREAGYLDIRAIIKQLGTHADKVAQKVRERHPPPKPAKKATKPKSASRPDGDDGDDPLDQIVRTSSKPARDVEALEETLADPDGHAVLLGAIEDAEAEEREARRNQLPMQRLMRVLRELRQLELPKGTDDLSAIARTLKDIAAEVARLDKSVSKLGAGK